MNRPSASPEKSLAKQRYLIISTSANALAAAAVRAGYEVVSIDCFNDTDTADKTLQSFRLNRIDEPTALDRVLQQVDCQALDAVVIGSGFEASPESLSGLRQRLPVLANSTENIRLCADPPRLFAELDNYNIAHPETRDQPPRGTADGWLVKRRYASGGGHICFLSSSPVIESNDYFQRYIDGTHYSVNFLACSQGVRIIGVNRTWCDSIAEGRFAYAGAVSNVRLQAVVSLELRRWLLVISRELGLRGLCGLDFVVTEDGQMLLLDINPRPVATLELYDDPDGSLLTAHIDALQGNTVPRLSHTLRQNGHLIVYASADVTLPAVVDWPAWTVCRPRTNSSIMRGEPVCSVIASAAEHQDILSLLQQRRQTLLSYIQRFEC